MTALTYMVGNFKYKTYTEAIEKSKLLHLPVVTKYTPLEEKRHIDPMRYSKLIEKRRMK